jgi:hypothetical protein
MYECRYYSKQNWRTADYAGKEYLGIIVGIETTKRALARKKHDCEGPHQTHQTRIETIQYDHMYNSYLTMNFVTPLATGGVPRVVGPRQLTEARMAMDGVVWDNELGCFFND